ncbi:plastocyanin/azurin family copper-binding protein, partial [Flavobacteriales bacterium]|nr:plastocyanin/azurin family copper-binding protein [Flavobacteriales bacterium]
MKQNNLFGKCLITLTALFLSISVIADTHVINAGSYYYYPSSLTINLGDTVNWYNDGGFHNVNADMNAITGDSYNNPESFISSATSTTNALIYSHVFTVPGEYNYDCSIGNHAANGMVGTINVVMTNDITVPTNPIYTTFRVNMQNQIVNPSGVYMAGGTASFISGGGPPGIAMNDDDNDGIWEVTIPLEANSNFTWKFRNGYIEYWDGAPAGYWEPNFNGLGCGFGQWGDRIVAISNQDQTLDYCFASCDSECPAPDVNVTFTVNVEDFPDPVDSVQIQGTFIGWNPGNVINLTNIAGSIWQVSLILPANSDHEFRYIVNDQIETLPSVGSCVLADPTGEFDPVRTITTETSDLNLSMVCYASCLDCGEGIEGCTDPIAVNYSPEATIDMDGCLYDVEFAVDMTGFNDVAIQTVNVNGTFNGWCGTCNELYDDDGDNIYSAVIPLPAGSIDYLYTVNGFEAQEVFGPEDECITPIVTEDNIYYNRIDTVQAVSLNTMPVYCFSTCDACLTEDVEVVFSVDMTNEEVSENGVFLTGSFDPPNNFTLIPMTDVGNGIYEASLIVTSNIEYIYRYANGGFANVENVSSLECNAVNGYRGLIVSEASTLPTVCFNACASCSGTLAGCTDETAENYDPNATEDDGSCTYCCGLVTVDFTVDMNSVDYNTDDYTNVVINGSWTVPAWSGWGVELFDEDGDGIWTGSTQIDPILAQFEYVVAVTGPADEWSGWGQQWGNGCVGNNFLVIFEDGVATYDQAPTVGCETAASTVFTVDMNCVDFEYTTVHLTGPIWGWTDNIIMSDGDGDGVYSITMENLSGDIEYKYMVDYWASQEDLVDDMVAGATCAPVTDFAGYANRIAPAGATTADTYGSCEECQGNIGCTDSLAVNFNPNATEDDGSCDYCFPATINFSVRAADALAASQGDFDNVIINGSWDAVEDANGNIGWSSWGVTLTDDDGDGIFSGSLTLDPGDYQYVHALTGPLDGWSGWGQVGYAPDECALGIDPITGDSAPNYFFNVECGQTLNLPILCFGECTDCTDEVLGCTDANADNYNPNATEDDGSCTFCGDFEAVIFATSDASTIGGSDGYIQASGQGGSSNYDVNVFDADGVPQNPFALSAGNYVVQVTDITSSCDSELEFTISQPAGADPCDVVPSGLFVDNIIHNRVTFNWASTDAAPSHYMLRYRIVG